MYYRLFKLNLFKDSGYNSQDFSDFFPGYKMPWIKTEEQNYTKL